MSMKKFRFDFAGKNQRGENISFTHEIEAENIDDATITANQLCSQWNGRFENLREVRK